MEFRSGKVRSTHVRRKDLIAAVNRLGICPMDLRLKGAYSKLVLSSCPMDLRPIHTHKKRPNPFWTKCVVITSFMDRIYLFQKVPTWLSDLQPRDRLLWLHQQRTHLQVLSLNSQLRVKKWKYCLVHFPFETIVFRLTLNYAGSLKKNE